MASSSSGIKSRCPVSASRYKYPARSRYRDTRYDSLHILIIFAIAPDDGDDMKHLISAADTAMYKAKNLGKNRYAMASS
ncbi:MAG: diguanylate cyclase [Pseudomonadales bacterium]